MAVTEEIIPIKSNEGDHAHTAAPRRGASGMVRLLGLSGIAMALVLPIGVYPRIMQSQELEGRHAQIIEKLPEVTVAAPVVADPSRAITLPGTVEALQETAIYGRADGFIKARFADIGDRVKAGQVLADIETPEVDESAKEAKALVLTQVATKAQIQANLDKAKADLDTTIADLAQARANLIERQSNERFARISESRWRILAEDGAVSTHESDDKANNYTMSKASTQAAKDRINSLEAQVIAARAKVSAELANINVGDANIDAAQARQNRTKTQQHFNKVAAPFAGVITERNIDPGMLITAGSENSKQAMYRIARIDTVKVFVDVPQYASSGIRVGQTVDVSLKEFPGRKFTGRVLRTSVALDASARTLKTEIHIANKELLLTPGMYADVSFNVPRNTRAYLIPANALITRGDGTQVVLADNGIIDYRTVQIGDDLGKQVEVVTGLVGTEKVVVNPSDALKKGEKVTVDGTQGQ